MKRTFISLGFASLAVATIVGMSLAQGQQKNNGSASSSHPGPATPYSRSKPVAHVPAKSNVPEAVWKALDARFAPADEMHAQAKNLLRQGKFAEAEQACNKAIVLYQAQGSLGRLDVPDVRRTLGDVYLAEGKYQRALDSYDVVGKRKRNKKITPDLNAALCYARLGDYETARQYYTHAGWGFGRDVKASDLPGTQTPQTLEASILMGRGAEDSIHGDKKSAFEEFDAALKLVPNNGFIAYRAAKELWYGNRQGEAGPYFVKAVQNGHSAFVNDARDYVPASMLDQIARVPSSPPSPDKKIK